MKISWYKYLATLIIGFVIGLTINLGIELSAIDEMEPPEHVQRYQHLISFEQHAIDESWAQQTEDKIHQLFAGLAHHEISYLACFTDVCAISTKANLEADEEALADEWGMALKTLQPTLRTSMSERFDLSPNGNILILQFSKV